MKRDMDVIRRILLAASTMKPGEALQELDGVDDSVFSEHVNLLVERGLVDGGAPISLTSGPIGGFITRLTWEGQDFVDLIEGDTAWNTAKARVIRPGVAWSFDVLKEVLKAIAMKSAGLE